ncbi:MerR family transcriptional regulator [Caulobacter segnis]
MSDARYTARELAALCDVSERTVRYYVAEGLLPPPAARGRGANFDDSHLTRLRLIRAMQQAGNDLEAIGDYLRELEAELAGRSWKVSESALAVWSGRTERLEMAQRFQARWNVPEPVHRYRIAPGVEVLISSVGGPPQSRLQAALKAMREALEGEDAQAAAPGAASD